MDRDELLYDSSDEEIIHHLSEFTPMETAFRNYYLIHTKEMVLDPKASEIAENAIKEFDQRKMFLLPDDRRFFSHAPIAIRQHARYMPPHLHTHAYVELFYVVQGQCVHRGKDRFYTLVQGDFCFWQDMFPHEIISYDDDLIALNIMIRKPFLQNYILEEDTGHNPIYRYMTDVLTGMVNAPLMIFHTGEDAYMKHSVLSFYKEYYFKNEYWQDFLASAIKLLFIHLLRYHKERLTTSEYVQKSNQVLLILSYLQNHFETITLEEAAKHFGYTPSYFSRFIKEKTGRTFTDLILQYRMNQAAQLLNATDLSMADIADRLAFADASHFSRVFKKYHGISPKDYRKAYD